MLLLSGHRYILQRFRTNRIKNSFVPAVFSFSNDCTKYYDSILLLFLLLWCWFGVHVLLCWLYNKLPLRDNKNTFSLELHSVPTCGSTVGRQWFKLRCSPILYLLEIHRVCFVLKCPSHLSGHLSLFLTLLLCHLACLHPSLLISPLAVVLFFFLPSFMFLWFCSCTLDFQVSALVSALACPRDP